MNLKMSIMAVILPALVLSVSCNKNNSTESPASHSSVTGQWVWQYATAPADTVYPRQDSSVEIAFAADSTFTLSLNGNVRASGTLQWQDSILVLTSSAPINNADYAQSVFFNGTNPSEYFVQLSQNSLLLSRNFIIPGATTPYTTPIEPQIMVFTYVNPGAGSVPSN